MKAYLKSIDSKCPVNIYCVLDLFSLTSVPCRQCSTCLRLSDLRVRLLLRQVSSYCARYFVIFVYLFQSTTERRERYAIDLEECFLGSNCYLVLSLVLSLLISMGFPTQEQRSLKECILFFCFVFSVFNLTQCLYSHNIRKIKV